MHFGKDLAYLTIFDIQNSGTNQLALGWRVDWHKEFRGQLQLTLPNWQNKKLPNFDDWQISMMVGGGVGCEWEDPDPTEQFRMVEFQTIELNPGSCWLLKVEKYATRIGGRK